MVRIRMPLLLYADVGLPMLLISMEECDYRGAGDVSVYHLE